MADIAISVQGIGKRYRLGRVQKYRTLRDSLIRAAGAPIRALRALTGSRSAASSSRDFWALTDVSFDVRRGEVIGVIGANGSGKSTLLKILSRITEPTVGRGEIRGRVGSLLEVGTGFHRELTGRENVYLNGAILGMRRREIARKFDQIVEFAELARFIDTPVKHYSSGMYVRLAFAVAAHLEPEILLVDEVLAVGDAAFQRKCIGKMDEVAKAGRTVLFVSHNMSAVASLCDSALLLKEGRVAARGPTDRVIQGYVEAMEQHSAVPLGDRRDRKGNGRLRFSALRFMSPGGRAVHAVQSGDPVRLVIAYTSNAEEPLMKVSIAADFCDAYGQRLFSLSTALSGGDLQELAPSGELICDIPELLLVEDRYRVDLRATVSNERADQVPCAGVLEVIASDGHGTGVRPDRRKHGTFLMPHSWQRMDSHVAL
jgi:lipopolysaccharide transport system ATP-binding protein